MDSSCDMVVVSHTHWDREWYKTFEQFRFVLVRALDELIESMEKDATYTHFLLDGQTIVIEDYLEIRPERRERLRRLTQAGRISVGPWYLQPDEQLVSGESLVRNLLIGHRTGAEFGPIMKEGYVPDTFGHIAQLPQILQGFDIPSFYTMRGTSEDLTETKSEVYWQAPDGSRVWSHHMLSYSNAAVLGPTPEQTRLHHGTNINYDSLDGLKQLLLAWASSPTLLLLNGNDHLRPQPDVAATIRSLNAHTSDNVFLGSLEDFRTRAMAKNDGLTTIYGERVSGRYQKILQGVLSTRMYLKQRNSALETLLSRVVEPVWTAAWTAGAAYPDAALRAAWKHLIRNHPHDSICGCSIDRVHRDMVYRYDQAQDLADSLLADGLEELASRADAIYDESNDEIALLVFNPAKEERDGVLSVAVDPYIGYPYGVREFAPSGFRQIDLAGYESEDGFPVRVTGDEFIAEDMLNRRKNVRKKWLSVGVGPIPALGYRVVVLRPSGKRAANAAQPLHGGVLTADGLTIRNDHLSVTAAADGTFSVRNLSSGKIYAGLNMLEDEADRGDEYTFCGIPEAPLSSSGARWSVDLLDNSPLEVALRMRCTLQLPATLSEDRTGRSAELVEVPVECVVTLQAGRRYASIRTTFDNRVHDHRLRAVFPAGFSVAKARAESAFCVLDRSTAAADGTGWTEQPCTTHAQQRYVAVESPDGNGGLALFNRGLPEYEVTPAGEIKLTLVRGVEWLSRPDLDTRPGDAGPQLQTPEAQCLGVTTCEYAVMPYSGSFAESEIWTAAEDYTVGFVAARVRRTDRSLPSRHGLFSIDGTGLVLTAVKHAEDEEAVILRVFNTLGSEVTGTVECGVPIAAAWMTNLNEENSQPLPVRDANRLAFSCGPYRIVTLKLVPRRN